MVGMTRFERATPSSQARCATKLRYIPIYHFIIAPTKLSFCFSVCAIKDCFVRFAFASLTTAVILCCPASIALAIRYRQHRLSPLCALPFPKNDTQSFFVDRVLHHDVQRHRQNIIINK